jgi:tetratricopeptide (TPR) repeat protein
LSSQIGRLVELGYAVGYRRGRETLYELREPLMRLALEVKKSRGQPLRLIVELLRHLFTEEQISERLDRLAADDSTTRDYLLGALKMNPRELSCSIESICDEHLQRLLEEEKFEEALKAADDLVAAAKSAPNLVQRARVKSKLNDDAGALMDLNQAVELAPNNVWARLERVQINFDKDPFVARHDLAWILNHHSADADQRVAARIMSGKLFEREGRTDAAQKEWAAAINTQGAKDRDLLLYSFVHLAHSLKRQGHTDKALAMCSDALSLSGISDMAKANALLGKARILVSAERFEEAHESFQKIMGLDGDDETLAVALLGLAETRAVLNDSVGALEAINAAAAKKVEDSRLRAAILRSRGAIKQKMGDYAASIDDLSQALMIEGTPKGFNGEVLLLRGRAYQEAGSVDEAIDDLTLGLSNTELNKEYLYDMYCRLANLGLIRRDMDLTLRNARLAIAKNPNDLDVLSAMAIAQFALAQTEQVMTTLDRMDAIKKQASLLSASMRYLIRLLDSSGGHSAEQDFKLEAFKALSQTPVARGLLLRTQDPLVWRRVVPKLIAEFDRAGQLEPLGANLVETLLVLRWGRLPSETILAWADVWHELAAGHEGLSLAARLLKAGATYLVEKNDRVLLALAAEEREIITPMLGVGEIK